MNIQAMMKQAQKLQKEMMETKNNIEKNIYEGKSSFITVEMTGDKKIKKIKIDTDKIEKDEIELIEDMICLAVNSAIDKINKDLDDKMGKYTQGFTGLL
ncbi:MAG TPA: YbaB/EbfC family nucleoid-associated protein [Tenericutes bacterium]|nr:YbaB/EbfC family nucleoid-associated protein [Mycoplasmatota bacterium]